MLILHGVAGGFDELLIAVAAVAVLWIALKLAGRKPASDDENDAVDDPGGDENERSQRTGARKTPQG